MKKKEIIIITVIALIAIASIFGIRYYQNNQEPTGNDTPTQTAQGQWIGVIHRNNVAKWFDSGVDQEFTVTGDYGDMTIEVKDGKWHVKEVECPNHTCEQMGWDDGTNFVPITCIPNNILIGTASWVETYLDSYGE